MHTIHNLELAPISCYIIIVEQQLLLVDLDILPVEGLKPSELPIGCIAPKPEDQTNCSTHTPLLLFKVKQLHYHTSG